MTEKILLSLDRIWGKIGINFLFARGSGVKAPARKARHDAPGSSGQEPDQGE
jgi:hypothetical protein